MIVSDSVIIADDIAHKAGKILAAVRKGRKPSCCLWYGVTTALEPDNLLYILSSREFQLPMYQTGHLRLLGLAGSKEEARIIVLKLVKSGYAKRQITTMKQFLNDY